MTEEREFGKKPPFTAKKINVVKNPYKDKFEESTWYGMTDAEIDDWCNTNIISIPDVKEALKQLIKNQQAMARDMELEEE
jgi:hypothetical protein